MAAEVNLSHPFIVLFLLRQTRMRRGSYRPASLDYGAAGTGRSQPHQAQSASPMTSLLSSRQFLGEHCHALAPGARHLGDVGSPKHSVGAERIVDLPQISVERRKR